MKRSIGYSVATAAAVVTAAFIAVETTPKPPVLKESPPSGHEAAQSKYTIEMQAIARKALALANKEPAPPLPSNESVPPSFRFQFNVANTKQGIITGNVSTKNDVPVASKTINLELGQATPIPEATTTTTTAPNTSGLRNSNASGSAPADNYTDLFFSEDRGVWSVECSDNKNTFDEFEQRLVYENKAPLISSSPAFADKLLEEYIDEAKVIVDQLSKDTSGLPVSPFVDFCDPNYDQ